MRKCISISILSIALIVSDCKHKPDIPPCVAGSGGSLTIIAYAKHGSISIPNYYTHPDTAFVKFGTRTFPGNNPGNYDTYFLSVPGEDHIHCFGLTCGDYFIYRTAWDSVENVIRYGGDGISLSGTSGEVALIVAVN
jgi:hypothetical protein